MIRAISEHISDALVDYVETYFPLVELKSDDKKTFPAYYEGGEYKHVSNFDSYNGMAYLRVDGKPIAQEYTDETVPCANVLQFIYPIRVVFAIPRSKVKTDDAFAKESLAMDLIRAITTKGGPLKATLLARSVSIMPTAWDVDSIRVLKEEYEDHPIDINYKFIYGMIGFNVDIIIKKDCIKNSCDEVCYG